MSAACLHEPNLDSLVQGRGDPVQHRQGMTFVVGTLQTADDRCGGADKFGKLPPGEAGLYPKCGHLPGDTVIGSRFFSCRQPIRPERAPAMIQSTVMKPERQDRPTGLSAQLREKVG